MIVSKKLVSILPYTYYTYYPENIWSSMRDACQKHGSHTVNNNA
jgi:hypothetical protein